MQKPIYSPVDEQNLMAQLWSPELANDPEKFVVFAFPWGVANTPLAKHSGPRKWQRKILRKIAQHIKDNDGKIDFSALRCSIA